MHNCYFEEKKKRQKTLKTPPMHKCSTTVVEFCDRKRNNKLNQPNFKITTRFHLNTLGHLVNKFSFSVEIFENCKSN